MPVRLRVEVRRRDLNEGVMLTALVNTGFTGKVPRKPRALALG
ncbi:hypothetical protein [Candidatus Methanodesulfokora washburnensis]|nr:hypothetical protein [Candidatus Methanodesulfokores washburnensis]